MNAPKNQIHFRINDEEMATLQDLLGEITISARAKKLFLAALKQAAEDKR